MNTAAGTNARELLLKRVPPLPWLRLGFADQGVRPSNMNARCCWAGRKLETCAEACFQNRPAPVNTRPSFQVIRGPGPTAFRSSASAAWNALRAAVLPATPPPCVPTWQPTSAARRLRAAGRHLQRMPLQAPPVPLGRPIRRSPCCCAACCGSAARSAADPRRLPSTLLPPRLPRLDVLPKRATQPLPPLPAATALQHPSDQSLKRGGACYACCCASWPPACQAAAADWGRARHCAARVC